MAKHNLYYFTIPVSETFEPQFPKEFDTLIVEHFEDRWVIPRNRMVERFLRKSRRVYREIGSSLNKYTKVTLFIPILEGQIIENCDS